MRISRSVRHSVASRAICKAEEEGDLKSAARQWPEGLLLQVCHAEACLQQRMQRWRWEVSWRGEVQQAGRNQQAGYQLRRCRAPIGEDDASRASSDWNQILPSDYFMATVDNADDAWMSARS